MQSMRSRTPVVIIAFAAFAFGGRAPIDAHRLATGQFVYRTFAHGREVGQGRVTIRRLADPERYEFKADITGDANQRWTAIATPAFVPLSATITFGPDTVGNEPRFSLTYHDGRVTGFVVRGSRRSIDTIVPAGIVDQRIDWAAVMASDLTPGRELRFSVYDPSLGVSPVLGTVGPVERVEVAAGTFNAYHITYRIAKATGTVEYQVYATRAVPRMMIREIFPDSVVSDLSGVVREPQ
jgi:hypothetical protein